MTAPGQKALQKPEESVRRPQALDDTVLLGLLNNGLRQIVAEIDPVHLVGTINAIVSQLRQIQHGTASGHWSDLPAITLDALAALRKWRVTTHVIASGTTLALDTNALADFSSAKYYVELTSADATKKGAFEMLASRQGLDVTDAVYSILGFRFSANVNFHVVSTDAVLEVTNNEAFALSVKLTKLSD